MNVGAERILDELIDYDKEFGFGFPILAIVGFFNEGNIMDGEDFQALKAKEEIQIIEEFLESAY